MARLIGMDAIEDYFKRSPKMIRRLIQTENFPAVLISGTWESDTELIDRWIQRRIAVQSEMKQKSEG